MGRRHLRAYAALRAAGLGGLELVAVCDPDPGAAAAAADLAGDTLGRRPRVVATIEEALELDEVGAIDLVTEPYLHHVLAVTALEAGRHVICEKPLGLTVRACRLMIDAARHNNALLATAENYRHDPVNRLARAVLDHGLLGEVHLLVEHHLGGSDAVIISPWRHLRHRGSIALDMGVHFADLFQYYLGGFDQVFGRSLVAEPLRRLPDPTLRQPGVELVDGTFMRATGEDSLLATFKMASGVVADLAYLPSGPGRGFAQRSVHGTAGSMVVPGDRSGRPVEVTLGERRLSSAALRAALGGYRLDGAAARLFGEEATDYELPFEVVDANLIALELADFADALAHGRSPEVDGRGGLDAVAAVHAVGESELLGAAVEVAKVASGRLGAAQVDIDQALGILA